MNRKLMVTLLFAFILAAGCSLLVYRILGRRVNAPRPQASSSVVAVANDVKLGSILTKKDLTTIQIAGTLPKGAILKEEDAVGRGVVSDLYQGEPVINSRLAAPGSGGGLAATIPPGMRACAVKVDEVVGVAGFVTPGMRVDVLVTGDPPGAPDPKVGTEVKTLLQNIAVLSAGTDIQKDAEGKPQQVRVVNLLVTPEQAEELSLASSHTQIQLVLRNPLDTNTDKVQGSAMANLFSDNKVKLPSPASFKPVAKAAPKSVTVEVLNGSQRSAQTFPVPEGRE
jgi:pilus assembly protein CpaB